MVTIATLWKKYIYILLQLSSPFVYNFTFCSFRLTYNMNGKNLKKKRQLLSFNVYCSKCQDEISHHLFSPPRTPITLLSRASLLYMFPALRVT